MITISTTNGKAFKAMFKILASTMSTESTRYYLNGVAFRRVNGNEYFCSTDGHRLSKIDLTSDYCYFNIDEDIKEGEQEEDFSFIIPSSIVNLLLKLPLSKHDVVILIIKDDKAFFNANGIEFAQKLIDGTYPNIEKVIPEKTEQAIGFRKDYVKQFLALLPLDKTIAFELPKMEDGSFNTSSPTVITSGKGTKFIIMPTRI